jgi:hypothetical protein
LLAVAVAVETLAVVAELADIAVLYLAKIQAEEQVRSCL